MLLLASSHGVVACGSRTGLEVPQRDASVSTDAPPVASCGPETCGGCCSDAGACLAGDAQASCGEQGRACVACQISIDEICNPQPGQPDERVCWAPCDPRLCNGGCCIADGTCIQVPSDRACGSVGRLCTDCTALGQTCGTIDGERACVSQ